MTSRIDPSVWHLISRCKTMTVYTFPPLGNVVPWDAIIDGGFQRRLEDISIPRSVPVAAL